MVSPRKRRGILPELSSHQRSPDGRSHSISTVPQPPLPPPPPPAIGTRRRSNSVVSELLSPAHWKEMGSSSERKVLTEKEKAERWEDLLERSARAGGTLHLGAGGGEDGLKSDQLL